MSDNRTSSPALSLPRVRPDLLALGLCIALFAALPRLDLAVSALLLDAAGGFRWANEPLVLLSYELFKAKYVGWVVVALLVYLLAACFGLRSAAGRRRAVVFLLLFIVTGPVLLVNTGLKDQWGRARPIEVVQFGGSSSYSPPLAPASQCDTNCSFVSAHAAAGFALIGLYWTTRRRRWLAAGILLGSAVGIGRMMRGAHFLSDIVFAFWAVYLTGLLLEWLLLREHQRAAAVAGLSDLSDLADRR
ncbi:MAG: phosphatase PAP2 family protein [Burkholderiaceae bacterium]|nr:phosphatase PAP2 family protein [Burkholderiaceae bacterium]